MFYFSLGVENSDGSKDFTKIMQTFGNDVLRVAYIYVKDKQRSEDICQDVFVKALINKVYLFPEDKQRAWLMKVTMNTCKNHLKSYWNKNVNFDNEIAVENKENSGSEIESQLIKEESKNIIVQAIYELPVKYKQIIILYFYQEYDTTQISSILRLPRGTVKSRFARARELLYQKIGNI